MSIYIKPTRQIAAKIVELLSYGLTRGKGQPEPGKMCVEAAVCFAMGLPHSDEPPCVGVAVRSFKIALNDCSWSSDKARADGLRRVAIAQLGSDTIDQTLFVKELTLATVRQIVPIALRAAAGMKMPAEHKKALEEDALKCESVGDLAAASDAASDAARAASDAASDAARAASDAASYAARAASYAASYAARAASDAASDAARAASDAASDAARAASYAARAASDAARAASDAASDAARAASDASDQVLCIMAESAVQALIVCKSPGCEWLDLAPLKEVA